jgi:hypothetical protein
VEIFTSWVCGYLANKNMNFAHAKGDFSLTSIMKTRRIIHQKRTKNIQKQYVSKQKGTGSSFV